MSDDIKDKIDLIAEESITKISKSENLNELEDLNSAGLPDGFGSLTLYIGDSDDKGRQAVTQATPLNRVL